MSASTCARPLQGRLRRQRTSSPLLSSRPAAATAAVRTASSRSGTNTTPPRPSGYTRYGETEVADRLPSGIHFRSGETPPDFFRFATFNFTPTATAASAKAALAAIWTRLEELRLGEISD